MPAQLRSNVVRFLVPEDCHEVLAIDGLCNRSPWNQHQLTGLLARAGAIGFVVESPPFKGRAPHVLGFAVFIHYHLHAELIALEIAPRYRALGLGRALLDHAAGELEGRGVRAVMVSVRETDRGARGFLTACGFRAATVLRDRFREPLEDAYRFAYRFAEKPGGRRFFTF
jgi:ribosomal protein S18 acetylase RimI-like enzyme